MSFGPIQLLDFVVDPTAEALLSDDGQLGQTPWGFMFDVPGVGITDVSEGGGLGAGGYPDPRHSGHYVRRGGSGVHRNKGTKVLPHAVDDTLTVNVGDAATDKDVLANDTYSGTPTIVILSGPNLDGAIARVVGAGASSRIRYTPPATGYPDGANDEVTYWLRATGNSRSNGRQRSQDTATLRVSIANTPDPHIGSYDGTISSYANRDAAWPDRISVAFPSWNGSPATIPVYPNDESGAGTYGPIPDPSGVGLLLSTAAFDALDAQIQTGTLPLGASITMTLSSVEPTDGAFFGTFTVH